MASFVPSQQSRRRDRTIIPTGAQHYSIRAATSPAHDIAIEHRRESHRAPVSGQKKRDLHLTIFSIEGAARPFRHFASVSLPVAIFRCRLSAFFHVIELFNTIRRRKRKPRSTVMFSAISPAPTKRHAASLPHGSVRSIFSESPETAFLPATKAQSRFYIAA